MFFANSGGTGTKLAQTTAQAGALTLQAGSELLTLISALEANTDGRISVDSREIAEKFRNAAYAYRSIAEIVPNFPIQSFRSIEEERRVFEQEFQIPLYPTAIQYLIFWNFLPRDTHEPPTNRALFLSLANQLQHLSDQLEQTAHSGRSANEAFGELFQITAIWNFIASFGQHIALQNRRYDRRTQPS